MGKQHQILAVLARLKKSASDTHADCIRTFQKAGDYFSGSVKVTTAHDEARSKELNGIEHKALVTTVRAKLKPAFIQLANYLNGQATVDKGNQVAEADLIVDGKIILTAVPAITLLAIEREATKVLELLEAVPIHTIGVEWIPAPEIGDDVFKSKYDQVSKKQEQTIVGHILAPATDKHPAQIDKLSKQVPVADYTLTLFSGAVTASEKAALCERAKKIINAASEAVTRANDVDAPVQHYGDKVFEYILG